MVYVDTHVVVWLYAGRLDLLSGTVRAKLNADDDLRISPMVLLELEYLRETRRTTAGAPAVYGALHQQIGLQVCGLGFAEVIEAAAKLDWTRDPFDRIIAGHAAAAGAPLITRDETIRRHYDNALW
jgi:PIN domain nuclease of toxin-antitoxin system